MRRAACAVAVLAAVLVGSAHAGWRDDVALSGYVRESPLWWQPPALTTAPTSEAFTNLVHTRENLRWYASSAITAGLDVKTRLFVGDGIASLLAQSDRLGSNRTYFDGTHRIIDHDRIVLIGAVDRAWAIANAGPVQATLGRQRVAWGTALAWNPIDIFNPASPLDFDNIEKPGTDAARAQIYLGPRSKVDVAVAPSRHADAATGAVELRLSRWQYDWIVIGGRRGPETVLGAAWAGSIGGGGFRGEMLVAMPRQGSEIGAVGGDETYVLGTLDGDYTFRSSLYLHGAILLNTAGTTGPAGGLRLLAAYARQWPSPARLSLLAEAAHNLSPLVHADLVGIVNPDDGSWYLGPAVTWSIAANLEGTAMGLIFGGEPGTEFGDDGEIAIARLTYSF